MKNVASGSMEVTTVEPGFKVLRFKNSSGTSQSHQYPVDTGSIQFHFGMKGNAVLSFNSGSYELALPQEKSLLLYNPLKNLPLDILLQDDTWCITVLISIQKFHSLFSTDSEHISFLSEDNRDKKYYTEGTLNPAMAVVLHQLMQYHLDDSIKQLYFKGKAYELLSLYFYRPEGNAVENCPFLADEENVRKIRQAKEIIIKRMTDPPTLQVLSDEIHLPLKKLKEGFKELYGDTVYGYLLEHKLQESRRLLDSHDGNVNHVAAATGYSSASHFISAFKKRFGVTPKKYVQGALKSQ